jgi:hypothetical protein
MSRERAYGRGDENEVTLPRYGGAKSLGAKGTALKGHDMKRGGQVGLDVVCKDSPAPSRNKGAD